jgi:hypothetical protein
MLGRQSARARGSLPTVDHEHHADKRRGVEQEYRPWSRGGHDGAAEGGTDSTGEVESGGVERHRLLQLRRGHHLGNNRLPRRTVHGRTQPKRERQC